MVNKVLFLLAFVFLALMLSAQKVEVETNFNGVGDCIFSAQNFAKTPRFLYIDFVELQNTSFTEDLPYVKKLSPGFSSLFTLERYSENELPRFDYKVRYFRSNPIADVNLDFPYLIPFKPGAKIKVFDVENIVDFWGDEIPKAWKATGFKAGSGDAVYASRKGGIVEIVGDSRTGNPEDWYHTWTNSITILQSDGTLAIYKNVIDKNQNLDLNQTIYAGELLGELAPNTDELVLLFYQNVLTSVDLLFIIPQFVVAPDKLQIVNPTLDIEVVHPLEIRGLEMTKKEKKKLLKSKK